MARNPFKLKSGNAPPFKQMASVPAVTPPPGGMSAPVATAPPPPPPPPPPSPAPVSPAVPQLKGYRKMTGQEKAAPFQSKGHGKDDVENHHEEDDTFVRRDQPTDTTPTTITTNKFDAINTRLNKLKATDTAGWSSSKLQAYANKIKTGQNARKKELERIKKLRSL